MSEEQRVNPIEDDMEVEVHVKQIDSGNGNVEPSPVLEAMRRLLLASIGAIALTVDEAEKFTQRLVERGELAQKDGEKIMNEMTDRFKQQQAQVQQEVPDAAKALNTFEENIERILSSLSIPSKRDIDELSAKIAQLSARVEELRTPSSSSTADTTSSEA